jgi:hypothetical protein
MANVFLNLKTTSNRQDIANVLNAQAGKILANNIDKLQPIIKKTINRTVEENKNEFIPTDREAAELGIGEGGCIDRSRTQDAWMTMLIGGSDRSASSFAIFKGLRGRTGEIALLSIAIDENILYRADLSNVPIDPSKDPQADRLTNIPWMQWLIEGAPRNEDFRFRPSNLGRTGEGTMRRGGIWRFRPARPGATDRLIRRIARNLRTSIPKNIGAAF